MPQQPATTRRKLEGIGESSGHVQSWPPDSANAICDPEESEPRQDSPTVRAFLLGRRTFTPPAGAKLSGVPGKPLPRPAPENALAMDSLCQKFQDRRTPGRIAAHSRWKSEPHRQSATQPARDGARPPRPHPRGRRIYVISGILTVADMFAEQAAYFASLTGPSEPQVLLDISLRHGVHPVEGPPLTR